MSVTQENDDESRFDRLVLVRFALAALLLTWLPRVAVADAIDSDKPPDDVMQADRDVASLAQDTDVRAAFEQYVTNDAVLFRPLPESAREWLANHEPANGQLDWAPAGALIACDRTLAVTVGNWRYTPPDARVAQTGQYLTAWRHDTIEGWRIVLDEAVPLEAVGALASRLRQASRSSCPEGGAQAGKLAEAESSLNAALRVPDAPAATAATHLQTMTGTASTDIAITYGVVREAQVNSGGEDDDSVRAVYVRVWQRTDETWQPLIDAVSEVPR